jgi:hypothetical protein
LDTLLENYPIAEDKIKLSQGFKNGFRLEYKGPRISITIKNLKSAVENKFITREKLQKEVKLERNAGPFPRYVHLRYVLYRNMMADGG